jgi:hypothetical protein
VTIGQTCQIVGHLYRNAAGNYTNFDALLDPTAGDFGTPDASFVGNSGINRITRVGIRTANPDPGALGLLGLGLAGMAFMRRRMA